MSPSGLQNHPLRESVEALIALLEKERRGGRDFIPLGPAGRNALAFLEGNGPRFETLEELNRAVHRCRRCRLGEGRMSAVPGEGDPRAGILIVGEAPGAEEDRLGRPFVGEAGQLLTRMLQAISLEREAVFIGNMVKCRPPKNRDPRQEELEACAPFLREQIRLINPGILVPLGSFAARGLTGSDGPISALRGKVFHDQGRLVLPTYHPAYLLRRPEAKRAAWEDLKRIRREVERIRDEETIGGKDPAEKTAGPARE